MGCMMLACAFVGKAQVPMWVEVQNSEQGRNWSVQQWTQGESFRLMHERSIAGQWRATAQVLQVGSYLRTGVRAGPGIQLSSSVDVCAQVGFGVHRWLTPWGVNRRVAPEFSALMRTRLDSSHTVELGFRFTTMGSLPAVQARVPIGMQGCWRVHRARLQTEARVYWSPDGSAVQWDAWFPLPSAHSIGVQWRVLSEMIGIQARMDTVGGTIEVGLHHPLRLPGAIWSVSWWPCG